MKNKNGRIIFWTLACFLALGLCSPATAADNHSHFEAEKVKPGVHFYISYRNQSDIDRDWFNYSKIPVATGNCPAPFSLSTCNAAFYDSTLDAAVLPFKDGVGKGQLRNLQTAWSLSTFGFTPITDEAWVQYEIYIDDVFLSSTTIDNSKLLRMFSTSGCTEGTTGRINDLFYYDRSEGDLWIGQEDCGRGCITSGYLTSTGFFPSGDTWLRFTYHFDFHNSLLAVWITNVATGVTQQVMNCSSVAWGGDENIKAVNPLFHTSSGAISGPFNDTFVAYRNIIVSKNPISFASTSTCPTGAGCSGTPGDLNSDGKVDIFDYSLFISNFGKTGTGLAADLNSDGKVDIFDYSMFISNFGK